MKIRIINNSSNSLPEYSTHSSAGLDLRADIEKNITLEPFERALVKTGLSIELPEGYEAQIRPRSGLAYKNGVTVLNSPGTIDADFRGNIGVILINLSNKIFTINKGDRIAQMVISRYNKVSWKEVSILKETKRGDEGFGSTGKK